MAAGRTGRNFGLAACALALAGCSGLDKLTGEPPPKDPNTVPVKYEQDVATFLLTNLTDKADYRGALIAPPALRPVGGSQRYVVCVVLNGSNRRKDKAAIYLGGVLTQFIDATPQQCADAQYHPFRELDLVRPG
jgi:hypothetical protein